MGMIIDKQLEHFLKATWESPVFGDTFPKAHGRSRLAWARRQLADIAAAIAPELIEKVSAGMPELDRRSVEKIVSGEIIPKTLAFCPALTIGELNDIPRLSAVAVAVGLMYWGDQTLDRGDTAMAEAIMLLGSSNAQAEAKVSKKARLRYGALRHIQEKTDALARPEDAPFVLACFYDQVLHNEVAMQKLSLDYVVSDKAPAFLTKHGRRVAEITTVSAGFPSISSSLYAIYRQHEPSLPPLAEIYGNPAMTNLLQTCNVVVRLWDELGDWMMDSGYDPRKGEFVINPFNQYDSSCVQRFCELAFIADAGQVAAIQQAFAGFHDSEAARQEHGAYILKTLRDHIRHYMKNLPAAIRTDFELYIRLCKRVMEIGYVNRIGDINLSKDSPADNALTNSRTTQGRFLF
ncbi:MAG TPA: hypothetical protein VGO07_04695 [Candidatus Saccharimonadales bacterium]|nr:hypothetical protein [Candidatus Saccharimonadales bacterium]